MVVPKIKKKQTFSLLPEQVRAQTRTDSTRSSSSTVSTDMVGINKPLPPPPVAVKPAFNRVNLPSEEKSVKQGGEEDDPANKSFLGKVV